MSSVLFRDARVLSMGAGPGPRRGAAMRDLGVLDRADVLVEGGKIAAVGAALAVPAGAGMIECGGRVLMPGFVDCHTHMCWAGDRVDEWERRLAGASYLELLEAGGGIMSTVRAVRAASEAELAEGLGWRLNAALAEGTTAVEVKSGYGLDTASELKMLRAIAAAAEQWPGTVRLTACIGHAIDPDQPDMVRRTIEQTLPAVHAEFPEASIDAYCEKGAWSLEECVRLFDAAAGLGHRCRVHADQFNALGMVDAAVERGFVSVDHLEASGEDGLRVLAGSQTVGVVLPCSGFCVDGRYADGRGLVDAGGAVAVATNCNPGSAPCLSVPMAIGLAVRGCALTAAEAIVGSTVNGAAVLGLDGCGRIAVGGRADLVVLKYRDERELAHSFGSRAVDLVMAGGRIVSGDQPAGSEAAS